MSKMDALRTMREARYEQRKAAPASRTAAPTAPARPAPSRAAAADTASESEPPTVPLCGHRAIGGRTCTRDQGHAAKSHRYS